MTCTTGDTSCEKPRRRGALLILGLMAVIFVVLSLLSFTDSRNQVIPDTVSYGDHEANAGKRVFQAFNCMGCHTMVGNGAYLGPDLTNIYEDAGPAWLAAFLPSSGSWPTEAVLRTHLRDSTVRAVSGTDTIEAYLDKFPGAALRIDRRGGQLSDMPNLVLTSDEVGQLIAYLKYTSAMNTEGWPPKIMVEEDIVARVRMARGLRGAADVVPAAAALPTASIGSTTIVVDPAIHGAQLVRDYGCVACHATTSQKLVGPGWGGLFGSSVELADGATATVDDAYLTESILTPDAKLSAGFPAGVMPAYDGLLKPDEVESIVAYIRTLEPQ